MYRGALNHRYSSLVKRNYGMYCSWIIVNIIHIYSSEHIMLQSIKHNYMYQTGRIFAILVGILKLVDMASEVSLTLRGRVWCFVSRSCLTETAIWLCLQTHLMLALVLNTWSSNDYFNQSKNIFRNRNSTIYSFQWYLFCKNVFHQYLRNTC